MTGRRRSSLRRLSTYAAYAPHSRLFPRTKINVHHGGIGTCGQALKAGRPQLVTPFLADQPENAARLARLGVARVIPGGKATATSLARELSALRDDPRYAAWAQELALIVAKEDGSAAAARRIAGKLHRVPMAPFVATLPFANVEK